MWPRCRRRDGGIAADGELLARQPLVEAPVVLGDDGRAHETADLAAVQEALPWSVSGTR